MSYYDLAYLHLAIIVPTFLLGTFLLLRRKGTPRHRMLGRIYLVLMIVTALLTLTMPARVGPQFFGHFGFIHALSLLVLYSAPAAWLAARRRDVKAHRRTMISLYVGGLLIAGAFAFAPGRLLHDWLFGVSTAPSAALAQ